MKVITDITVIDVPEEVIMKELDHADILLLAAAALGYPEEDYLEEEPNEDIIDQELMETFNVDLHDFGLIVEALLPLTFPVPSPLAGTAFHMLGIFEGKQFTALVKQEYQG